MDDPKKISPTQEILGNFLSQILPQKQQNVYVENSTNTESLPQSSRSNTEVRKTSDLLDTLQKALTIDTNRLELTRDDIFKVRISINSANQLPLKRRYKSKKTRSRKEQIEEALPSTYVTFETNPHGNLKITQVVPKSTTPKYDFVTEVNLPTDLLTNNQKKLIFKVWKKSTNITSTPNLQTDIILGFATLDLTVLLAGLPNVQGWFNIIDFSGKINGQVNIHVDPLEDLSKFHKKHPEKTISSQPNLDIELNPDEPSELIGRALKRKFTELDEITQRLRLRLSEVTREDSDCSNDEFEQQFEQDINSLSIEEDFNMINFEGGENSRENSKTKGFDLLSFASEGSSKSADHDSNEVLLSNSEVSNKLLSNSEASNNLLSNSEVSDQNGKVPQEDSSRNSEVSKDSLLLEERSLDRNLLEGKQKIDSLLEKLSLISNETVQPFGSRYVSGCSISNNDNQIDTEAILKDLDKYSRPNIQSNNIFDSDMFKRLYTGQSPENSSSNTSILTINCGDFRGVPEGEGPNSDDKVLKKS